ncbi:MAG TPA: hypothetical protein PKX48_15145 [Planctomycetota bacterium]|jgi:hypothetical protein|nr:LamG domain-containing protein [Planctomycetota bacterium]OQC19273.1 MAG: hypothetical protein BWX69_02843 [Planctomycetes bacterium ADurb.Bin069]HNS00198.1 hypothetical protein [Planctomycetota bacterium]HNU26835.1 hypothetical protein [Planctomycetota bacterium]HOE31293.1 hypothetical protein [Planctomycetota bacterium]
MPRSAAVLLAWVSGVLLGAPATLDTDPHLMAWWKFDEVEGTRALDSSSHGRHAELKGGLSFAKDSIAGRAGKALAVGGGGVIEAVGYKGVAGAAARTVAAWIKTKRPEGEIIAWGRNDFGAMWTFGFIRGRVGVTPKGGYFYMNPETHDGEWHHVAIVLAAAEAPNLHDHAALYKDGALAEIHAIGLLDMFPIATGSEIDVRIGARFEGALDDVRIYDRVLAAEEIKALFELRGDAPIAPEK